MRRFEIASSLVAVIRNGPTLAALAPKATAAKRVTGGLTEHHLVISVESRQVKEPLIQRYRSYRSGFGGTQQLCSGRLETNLAQILSWC